MARDTRTVGADMTDSGRKVVSQRDNTHSQFAVRMYPGILDDQQNTHGISVSLEGKIKDHVDLKHFNFSRG